MALLPGNPGDRNKIAVIALSVFLAFAYWYWVYAPKAVELSAIRTHVDSLETSNQRAKAEMAKGSANDLREQAQRYQENLQLMRQLVPTGNEVPALLEQVSTAARRVGLDIGSVEPLPVITGDQFDTYRYRMGVIGDYHSLGRFLANVGSLTRIIAPVNLQLTPAQVDPRARKKKDLSVLRSQFELQTYVAKIGPAASRDDGQGPPAEPR